MVMSRGMLSGHIGAMACGTWLYLTSGLAASGRSAKLGIVEGAFDEPPAAWSFCACGMSHLMAVWTRKKMAMPWTAVRKSCHSSISLNSFARQRVTTNTVLRLILLPLRPLLRLGLRRHLWGVVCNS